VRSERRSRDLRFVVGSAGLVPAARTLYLVSPELGDVRLDGRDLDHLVALRPRVAHLRQRLPAVLAVRREQVDKLVDLLGRNQAAVGSLVSRLSTTLALASALALALRLVLASLSVSGRVRRRGPMRVLRVLAQLLEQLRHLPLQGCGLLLQLANPRVPGPELRLQLCDALVPPVLGHERAHARFLCRWKASRNNGGRSITCEAPSRSGIPPVSSYADLYS